MGKGWRRGSEDFSEKLDFVGDTIVSSRREYRLDWLLLFNIYRKASAISFG